MKQQLLITYQDASGNYKYDVLNDVTTNNRTDIESSISYWQEKNPGCSVTHVFNTEHDLICEKSYMSKETFAKYCKKYGLSEDDMGGTLDNGMVVTGIRYKNRKYPIILYNPENGRNIKATPDYVRKHIVR